MFEIVLVYSLLALVAASRGGMRNGNPFQIYFLVWSTIFVSYAGTKSTWIEVDQRWWVMILASHTIWMIGLIALRRRLVTVPEIFEFNVGLIRFRVVFLLQAFCLLVLPFAYSKAVSLGGGGLLEHSAYRQLRHELSYGNVGYGWGSYVIILSFLLTSIAAVLKAHNRIGWAYLFVSIAVSIGYAFLSTGRTYVLLLTILVVAPLFFLGKIRLKGVVISLLGLFAAFLFSAALTGKGASMDAKLTENISDFLINIRAYTVAPFIAFSMVVSGPIEFVHGEYSARFFLKVLEMLGLGQFNVVELVRDYKSVPDMTNVYTFFEPYFRDFGYLAVLVSFPVMIFHVWLYLRAASGKKASLFFYCISLYPLTMQFFQDQYSSLLSTWVQFLVWMTILIGPRLRLRAGGGARV